MGVGGKREGAGRRKDGLPKQRLMPKLGSAVEAQTAATGLPALQGFDTNGPQLLEVAPSNRVPASVPEPQLILTEKAPKGSTIDMFLAKGWTTDSMIGEGYARYAGLVDPFVEDLLMPPPNTGPYVGDPVRAPLERLGQLAANQMARLLINPEMPGAATLMHALQIFYDRTRGKPVAITVAHSNAKTNVTSVKESPKTFMVAPYTEPATDIDPKEST